MSAFVETSPCGSATSTQAGGAPKLWPPRELRVYDLRVVLWDYAMNIPRERNERAWHNRFRAQGYSSEQSITIESSSELDSYCMLKQY